LVGCSYVIRFRENILVEVTDGVSKPAADWSLATGVQSCSAKHALPPTARKFQRSSA
jgi:hypothetical protein